VGEPLRAPLRFAVFRLRPVGRCVGGAVARPRHRRFRPGVPPAIPVVRATRREGDRERYSRTQLRAIALRCTTRRRLFSAEDADDPRTFDPRAALTESRRPLTSSSSPKDTPEPASVPSDALPVLDPFGSKLPVDLWVVGPRFTLPVKAAWAKARRRLPSSREQASRNPLARTCALV
jgi:hypothetical protein